MTDTTTGVPINITLAHFDGEEGEEVRGALTIMMNQFGLAYALVAGILDDRGGIGEAALSEADDSSLGLMITSDGGNGLTRYHPTIRDGVLRRRRHRR